MMKSVHTYHRESEEAHWLFRLIVILSFCQIIQDNKYVFYYQSAPDNVNPTNT